MKLEEWKKRNSQARRYAHFDEKVCLKNVWSYISNPEKIASHSFLPFIHYTAKIIKFNKNYGKKTKCREIYYSAHIDRYIFQYYGYLLNEIYNERAEFLGINNVAIAYRNNLHKSNIHFAKEAFNFIRSQNQCFIMVGDFTDFFDSLNHSYLKARLCDLLNVDSLTKDYYAVYKNITKYAYWELSSLLELNNLTHTRPDLKRLNEQRRVIEPKTYKVHRKEKIISNTKNFGIPQGSSISAVLSNIYMLTFDKTITDYVNQKNGLYLRYSDDFIFIIPENKASGNKQHFNYFMTEIKKVDNLILQPEKTQCFFFLNENLQNCNALYMPEIENAKDFLNYLGFTFDGKSVKLRDKTISKYYYRMYRKIRGINNRNIKMKGSIRQTSLHKLYSSFSIKGTYGKDEKTHKPKGNFLSYVNRSSAIFNNDPNIKNVTRRHMQKIRKRLNTNKDSNLQSNT